MVNMIFHIEEYVGVFNLDMSLAFKQLGSCYSSGDGYKSFWEM